MERSIHNTNSPNFVKLDFEDLNNIEHAFCSIRDLCFELTDSEKTTFERVLKIKNLMIKKRENDNSRADSQSR